MLRKTNKFQSICAVLLSVCALMLMALPVSAASAKAADRITFTNEKSDSTNLYISKTVESADSRFPAPANDRFSFVLELGGSTAKDEVYRVRDENGREVFLYADGESTESKTNKLTFATDRQGNFTLAAGQTAIFENVGEGVSYKVTELSKDNYTQTVPAGGVPAAGTLTEDGAIVNFTNRYIPKDTPQGETTSLLVSKAVIHPDGYSYPGDLTFGFTVKISGSPMADTKFAIRDTVTSETVGSGMTDGNGHFTLKGGQTAVFSKIPVNVDYEVTEDELAGGWRAVGRTFYAGATKTPVVMADFTNAIASFAVSKTVKGVPQKDDTFRFLLTKEDGSAFSDAEYYLYGADGNPVEENLLKTDGRGYFSLQAGQTAVFQGISPGTVYSVREDARSDYEQTVPKNVKGYENQTVTDAVEVLPFVNTVQDEKAVISVTKTVENITAGTGSDEQEFMFVLSSKKMILGLFSLDEYQPVANAVYSVRTENGVVTCKTDAGGRFTLHANETAHFKNMPINYKYKAEEISIPSDYRISSEEVLLQEGNLNDTLSFTFNNVYIPKLQTFTVTKHVKGIKGEKDRAFEFALTLTDGNGQPIETGVYTYFVSKEESTDSAASQSFTPDADGRFEFKLKDGESMKFELPEGISYQVEELNPEKLEKEGYEVTVAGEAEGILLKEAKAVFTNKNGDEPENPDKPEDPDNADTPDKPDNPDNPDNPDKPAEPGQPGSEFEEIAQSGTPGGQPGAESGQQTAQQSSAAKTGDSANIGLWIVLLVAALLGVVLFAWKKTK